MNTMRGHAAWMAELDEIQGIKSRGGEPFVWTKTRFAAGSIAELVEQIGDLVDRTTEAALRRDAWGTVVAYSDLITRLQQAEKLSKIVKGAFLAHIEGRAP